MVISEYQALLSVSGTITTIMRMLDEKGIRGIIY